MRIKKITAFFMVLIMMVAGMKLTPHAAERRTPSGIAFSNIGDEIERLADENAYASFAASVFCGDDVLYTGYYGMVNAEEGIAAGADSVYEWGSTSKTLVWVSVMQLYEQGRIDLNADIRTYLPNDFFKRLKYDDPITMLNLMNHDAGWQETVYAIQTQDESEITTLEEALRNSEPEQIFRPGEVSAYSNWGAALAGYIVERISGMDYAAYVHKNIFEPLGMQHTSILPDHSDTPCVKEQREKEHVYISQKIDGEAQNTSLGSCIWYVLPYPAGAATGTIEDMTCYAQALVSDENLLFEDIATRDLMFSASQCIPGSDLPLACHGFWPGFNAVTTYGHNGATSGGSANLTVDPVSKIGCVILSNEPGTSIMVSEFSNLIFGSIEDHPDFQTSEGVDTYHDISGFYSQSRTFYRGPMKFMGCMSIINFATAGEGKYTAFNMIDIEQTGDSLYMFHQNGYTYPVAYTEGRDGRKILKLGSMDIVEMPEIVLYCGVLAGFAVVTLIAAILLLIKLVRLIIRKRKIYTGHRFITMAQIAKLVSAGLMIYTVLTYSDHYGLSHVYFIVCALIHIICLCLYIASEISSFAACFKKNENNAKKRIYILNILGNIPAVMAVILLDLYMF